MKRLYFDDEHDCSEAYPQQIILLEVYYAGATLSTVVNGISAQNPSSLFLPPDLSWIQDQAPLTKRGLSNGCLDMYWFLIVLRIW